MTNTVPSLRITLSGIAALARVQRPVVSMWRSRSAASDVPFPAPIDSDRGQDIFDADAVAHWLVDTRHGNNPEAVADAAVHAHLAELSPGNASGFQTLTSLIALRAAHGAPIGGLDADLLADLADEVDPDDDCLAHEIQAPGEEIVAFARFVDVLVDGAYSASAAFENVMAGRHRDGRRDLVRATLSDAAVSLVASAALELAATNPVATPEAAHIVDPTGASGDLLLGVVSAAGENLDLTVATADEGSDAARLLRRRLLAHGILRQGIAVQSTGEYSISGPVVHVAQYPTTAETAAAPVETLSAIENTVLQMDDEQRAVIIAPARVLCDGRLAHDASGLRSAILRSGRVRAIVRLPAGLLVSSPRTALALWVLGPAHQSVALAERWTLVADISQRRLDEVTVSDLVSDLAAAIGDRQMVRAHAFRFSRLALTSTLLARSGSLVALAGPLQHLPATHGTATDAASTAIRIDELIGLLGDASPIDRLSVTPAPAGDQLPTATLGELAAAGHIRCLSGTRFAHEHLSAAPGFSVIGIPELQGETQPGERTIDRLLFADQYPTARLTAPGDIVFCTSPAPRAWVDREGSSVVSYPARILRVNTAHSAGLLPDVLAADIAESPPTSRDWKRWIARRIPPAQATPLLAALADVRRQHDETMTRLARLDELTALLTNGAAAGTLALTPRPAIPVAETQAPTPSKGNL